MKKTDFGRPNRMTLTVRTEGGAASIDIGLEWLTRPERKFLFNLVRDTQKGGTVNFGVEPGADGASIIKLALSKPTTDSKDSAEAAA